MFTELTFNSGGTQSRISSSLDNGFVDKMEHIVRI